MKSLIRTSLLASALITTPALADVCNPLSRQTCALPFPSDHWSVSNSSSPTGRTLLAPDTLLRADVLAQLPAQDGFTPSQIFNGSSGFSAASAVLFEFPAAAAVPADGGQTVIAWNLTRQQPIPVRAAFNDYARSNKVNGSANVLEIFPLDRWPYGDRILVAVTDQLAINDNFRVAGQCTDSSTSYCQELLNGLGSAGLAAAQVRNATMFTVRDRKS